MLWVLHLVLEPIFAKAALSLDELRVAFDELEGQGLRAIRARKAVNEVAKAVWQAYRAGRKRDPEHWTPNNFFKQTYGIKTIAKIAIPKAKKAVRPIGDHLVARG